MGRFRFFLFCSHSQRVCFCLLFSGNCHDKSGSENKAVWMKLVTKLSTDSFVGLCRNTLHRRPTKWLYTIFFPLICINSAIKATTLFSVSSFHSLWALNCYFGLNVFHFSIKFHIVFNANLWLDIWYKGLFQKINK